MKREMEAQSKQKSKMPSHRANTVKQKMLTPLLVSYRVRELSERDASISNNDLSIWDGDSLTD